MFVRLTSITNYLKVFPAGSEEEGPQALFGSAAA